MKVDFFGPSGTPLLGVFHAARTDDLPSLLICPSLGHENCRGHRALRILAERWSGAAFRFDWRGCGDSSGESPISLQQLSEDFHLALAELKTLSPTREVVVVGLRLGALIAAECSSETRLRVLGWHAPSSGAEWLDQIDRIDFEARNLSSHKRALRVAEERVGIRYPAKLLRELAGLSRSPHESIEHPISDDWTSLFHRELPWIPGPSVEMLLRKLKS